MLNSSTFSTKSTSCFVAGVSSPRITREEVVNLRSSANTKKTISHKISEAIHNACRDIQSVMTAPVKKAENKNSMCKYYGHIIQGAWQGYNPKCRDCGCEITSPDQLRKAAPTK